MIVSAHTHTHTYIHAHVRMCLLDRIGVSSPSQERGSHMWMKYIQYLCDATALFFSIFHEFIHACREGGHRKTTKTSRRQTAGDHCRAGDAACDHRVVHVVLCAILCVCVCVCVYVQTGIGDKHTCGGKCQLSCRLYWSRDPMVYLCLSH